MPLVKQCIQPACNSIAMFGFGVPSKPMRWACKQHLDLIWIGASPAPGEGGTGNFSAPLPSSPPASQGNLF